MLGTEDAVDTSEEYAICNSGYENPKVARLYEGIRGLIEKGFLEGRGNLGLPAGPRYTECRVTSAGKSELSGATDITQ